MPPCATTCGRTCASRGRTSKCSPRPAPSSASRRRAARASGRGALPRDPARGAAAAAAAPRSVVKPAAAPDAAHGRASRRRRRGHGPARARELPGRRVRGRRGDDDPPRRPQHPRAHPGGPRAGRGVHDPRAGTTRFHRRGGGAYRCLSKMAARQERTSSMSRVVGRLRLRRVVQLAPRRTICRRRRPRSRCHRARSTSRSGAPLPIDSSEERHPVSPRFLVRARAGAVSVGDRPQARRELRPSPSAGQPRPAPNRSAMPTRRATEARKWSAVRVVACKAHRRRLTGTSIRGRAGPLSSSHAFPDARSFAAETPAFRAFHLSLSHAKKSYLMTAIPTKPRAGRSCFCLFICFGCSYSSMLGPSLGA